MTPKKFLNACLMFCFIKCSCAVFTSYFKSITNFFGYLDNNESNEIGKNLLEYRVPYEVSINDEKFISEAAKLTGVTLSQLDSCQHRVIYKLQTSCHQMNDEELAKLAVMLMNCQSWVEGRKIYPCSENMSIRDCTKDMDPDAWNSYHLITNRARAVCFSVRQAQFRGLTELTINKLMDAAKNQLYNLEKISEKQDQLHQFAQETLQSVTEGHEKLISQQSDLQKAQIYSQLSIEDNIKRLANEKRLIIETHKELTDMTKSVQTKLDEANEHIQKQVDESKENHKELLDDLNSIQKKAEEIFHKIEQSMQLLAEQSQIAEKQYKETLSQLSEFNATIHYLVSLVDITKRTVDEQLSWLTTMLGGTDMAIEKLYAILWHLLFLITGMIGCAFLSAFVSIRVAVATFPVLNLALTLHNSNYALSAASLTLSLGFFIVVQLITLIMLNLHKNLSDEKVPKEMIMGNSDVTSTNIPDVLESSFSCSKQLPDISEPDYSRDDDIQAKDLDRSTPLSFIRSRSRTPLHLSSGLSKRSCNATTRKGTPCKLLTLPGRDYCSRHQYGDSVMVS